MKKLFLATYDTRKREAEATIFPSEIFDRAIDQINGFLKMLIPGEWKMKKTLVTVIFLQCLNLYGMQTIPTSNIQSSTVATLVAANYFDDEIRRFSQDIKSEMTRVNSGTSTVEQAIISITGNSKSWFNSCRAQINERYMKLVIAQQHQKQLEIETITAAKDQEIRILQKRLDTLLSAHTEGLEGLKAQLRIFDQQRVEAEQHVRTARERVDSTSTSELVTESQLRRTMDRLTRDLGTIRTEIQDGKRTLEEAFVRAEEKYSDGIETLIHGLEDRYADILSGVVERSTEKITHLSEAYEHQIELIRHMLDEAIAATKEAEKKSTLRSMLLQVPATNKNFIRIKALNAERMDIFGRHKTVEELYARFLPFSELFGRADLGVIATLEDLASIKTYKDDILIMTEPVCPPAMPVLSEYSPGKGGEVEWGKIHLGWKCWVNPAMRLWLLEMGVSDFYEYWPAGGEQYDWWGSDKYWKDCRPRAVAEYNRRKQTYDQKTKERNSQIVRATALAFPAVAFNRLVDQVNSFLIEGMR
ncbi:MAG: hypothetical protein LBQ08_01930 [Holosporaceae bacterium]|jgi:hypothetical protein|nr:hypothetical protein [Holosporaceae bacterium]